MAFTFPSLTIRQHGSPVFALKYLERRVTDNGITTALATGFDTFQQKPIRTFRSFEKG